MFDRQRDELAALLAAEDTSDTSGFIAQVVAAQTIGPVVVSEFGCCTYEGVADADGGTRSGER
jgi:hypothetical protein